MKKQILRIISAVLVLSMILALPVFAENTGSYSVKVTISGPQYKMLDKPDASGEQYVPTGTIGTISAESGDQTGSYSFATALVEAFNTIYDANAYDPYGFYIGTDKNTVNYVFIYTGLHSVVEKALEDVKTASTWSTFVDEYAFTSDQGDREVLKNLAYTLENAYNRTEDHTITFKFKTDANTSNKNAEYTVEAIIVYDATSGILPVSGDGDEVEITAKIEGTNITVTDVDFKAETVASSGTEVVINAKALEKQETATEAAAAVESVTLPVEVLNTLKDNNSSLTIQLTDNEITYNAQVIEAIAEKIDTLQASAGSEITIKQFHEAFNTAVEVEEEQMKDVLTPAQIATVEAENKKVNEDDETKKDVIVVNGYIELFVDGVSQGQLTKDDYDLVDNTEIEWTYKYPVKNAKSVKVFWLKDDGTMEEVTDVQYDGEYVIFTINHLSQYIIEKVMEKGTVSRSSSSSVQLAPISGPCPQDETCVYARFPDGDTHAWYHDAMHYCVENGLIKGITETKLSPNGNITRAQIAMILWRCSGAQNVNYAMSFSDVDGHWAEEAIRWGESVGVLTGYPDGTFRPNNSITRQEMVAMLYRFAKNILKIDTSKTTELTVFVDADEVGAWALESFQWSVANNVVNGMTSTTLEPWGTATRAQFAQIIYKLVKNL